MTKYITKVTNSLFIKKVKAVMRKWNLWMIDFEVKNFEFHFLNIMIGFGSCLKDHMTMLYNVKCRIPGCSQVRVNWYIVTARLDTHYKYTRDVPNIKIIGCFHPHLLIFDPFSRPCPSKYSPMASVLDDYVTSEIIFHTPQLRHIIIYHHISSYHHTGISSSYTDTF